MRRGLSFAETVISVFLLAGAALACVTLLLRGQFYQQRSLRMLEAASLADQSLNAVRSWAYRSDNFLTGWSLYSNLTFESQGMSVNIQTPLTYEDTTSPSTALESGQLNGARLLPDCKRKVRVAVRWSTGAGGQLVVNSWVAGPSRAVDPATSITVNFDSGSASPMAVNATALYSAQLRDSSGQVVSGATFHWAALPSYALAGGPGQASLDTSVQRSGHQIAMIHHFYAGDAQALYTVPGWVVLRATCRYDGREFVGDSTPIQLSP